jgi:hypothetical protein
LIVAMTLNPEQLIYSRGTVCRKEGAPTKATER